MTFAERIKALLEMQGWTQKHLAKLMETSEHTINLWVNGHRAPTGKMHYSRLERLERKAGKQ